MKPVRSGLINGRSDSRDQTGVFWELFLDGVASGSRVTSALVVRLDRMFWT